MKLKLSIVPLLILLAACASLGVPTAQTFNERLAAGYVSATSVRTSATTLLNGGVIGSKDAENVQKQCDNLRVALDVARTIEPTDKPRATEKLLATLAALTALQEYLEATQK